MTPQGEHERLIRECIRLARVSREKGNHPFGAVLTAGSEILLSAENTVNTEGDLTRHAELNLVRRALRELDSGVPEGAVLYSSAEPCAMCAGAIYWAGIPAVVYGVSAGALARLTGGSLVIPCREILERGRREVRVTGPVLESEAIEVHEGFWL